MTLASIHAKYGASLASDGIPLHYGDLHAEYEAGLHAAVLLDRSHEGRLHITGADRYTLLNRMSTNKIADMADNEGRSTIFTNANARILDRTLVYNRPDHLLLIAEPGRGDALYQFLKRHIFFNDQAELRQITAETHQLELHGATADAVMQAFAPGSSAVPALHGHEVTIEATTFWAARRKEISGAHWILVINAADASLIYERLMAAGASFGLRPAGSLTYNILRIRAGYPAGREISSAYLPLEVAAWDDVSFSKGCYTGQEIIARMESRARISRTLVTIGLTQFVEAPAEIYQDGKLAGDLTSSVKAPDGSLFALGVVKIHAAQPGTQLTIGAAQLAAEVISLPGAQPPYLEFNDLEKTN
jgi:tRNA-modifying protein YgfZ